MANLSYSNTPLIADLYDTPEAALQASANLGCSGYRTYNINGETKYVPCATFLAYEQSLRFKKVQGVNDAISGFGNIGDKAVGLQFANSNSEINGDPFFTLGNFSISTSNSQTTGGGKNTILSPSKEYTAEKINLKNPNRNTETSAVDQVNNKIVNNLTVTVLFDKDKLKNYVLFSPFKETVKNSIIDITNQFPAGLKMNIIGLTNPTVSEYNYTPLTDTSEFKVSLRNISNPYQIEYSTSGATKNDDVNLSPLRNFSKTYTNYVLYYNGVEYRIINATLPSSYEDYDTGLYLTVDGDPFKDDVNIDLTVNRTFWVKPKKEKYDEFYNKLPDMGKFLLNYDYDKKKYISNIKYTKTTDNGVDINTNETIIFPQYDEVNVDLFSPEFDKFLTKLNDIADSFDATKSNLVSRFLTTESLREFDTDDRRVNLLFNVIGRNFDNIRKYIDGITFMTNLSYDKVENIPDLLTKNFGNMLGFQTYNIEDENTLVESLFNIKELNVEAGLTPTEVDIELWRRIFINAYYLWKSKGTRKSIEFILNMVGLPDSIFEINEYVYQAKQKVDYATKSYDIYGPYYTDTQLMSLLPFDKDGYPTVPPGIKYQESGFNLMNDGRNFGPYDFGRSYIDAYKKQSNVNLFDVNRTIDNVKSWVYSENQTLRLFENTVGYTEYYEEDSRLIINSKELEVYISNDKIFDITIYRFLNRNEIAVNTDLNIEGVKPVNPTNLTFNQFMRDTLDNYIKVSNRKTVKTYPTLSKIYFDYIGLTNNPVTQTKSLGFLNMFDSSWVKLVQQFTPATTILNAGKKIQNSRFLDNKFVYKHGLNNSVAWVGTDGSEFQNKAKLPVGVGKTNPFGVVGKKKDSVNGETPTFTLVGEKGKNYVGTDPTINEYFGHYFGIEYACNNIQIYKWDPEKNYGDDTEFGGNINDTVAPRHGVFVVYENNLYRLNTNRMFSGFDTIDTYPIYESQSNILLGLTDDSEEITLPVGPGTYEITFTINSDDDLIIYDGPMSTGTQVGSLDRSGTVRNYREVITFTGSTVTFWNMNNYPNDMIISGLIIKQNHEPNRYKVLGENVYELIPLTADASTITFKDSSYGLITEYERNYYIDAIATGHAYLVTNDDYICPVPKPHTCYYDYSGLTINMSTPGVTSYYDETGTLLTIEQSKYYGYSKNTATEKPEDAVYGYAGNWVVPYRRPNTWTNGVLYYNGDVVTKSSVNYLVTGSTVTGYTVSGVPTGTTTTTIVPGQYQDYGLRTKTDPYMHIDSAYIKRVRLNPFVDKVSINLTKNLYLFQVYRGATQYETYKVTDNILNDELFLSDSTTLEFDGLYSLDETKIGPFYTADENEALTNTLIESLLLVADKDNYIDIQSLNENFNIANDNVGVGAGYYLVKNNSFLKIEFDLYFESEYNLQQDVDIKIMNQYNEILYNQTFSFSGNDLAQDRVVSVDYEDVFPVDSKIYLVVQPKTYECTLSRYEKIEIDYNEPTTYDSDNDPRFRVLFNAGRSILDGRYTDDVISIEPIVTNNNDFNIDFFLYKTDNNLDTYKFRPKPNLSLSFDETNYFGLLYGPYYEKYKSASNIGDVSVYEKLYNNDKLDFSFVVRSKEPIQSIINSDQSQEGSYREYTITSSDNYLGNTPQEIENTSLTRSIIIGKNPKPRTKKLNKQDLPFLRSYKNNSLLSSTASNIDFIGYDEGLADYDLIDYNGNIEDSFLEKRRYITSTGYYEKEKTVYNTELYKNILEVVPYFDQTINNYKLNDIVKVKLTDYKTVVESETGTTIEIKSVDRLYVCIEDITANHLRKKTGVTYSMNIHPIYQPNGARASFIPIEEYDVRSFTPIGYDKFHRFNSVKANLFPYRYETAKSFSGQPNVLFDMGDIIKVPGTGTTYTLYEYVYNKALPFDTANTYPIGSFVYTSGSTYNTDTRYSFWMKKTNSGASTGVTSVNWVEFRYTGATSGTPYYTFVDPSINPDHPRLALSPAATRVKNLIPTMEDSTGNRIYVQYTGITNMVFADMAPSYLPTTKTANELDGVDIIDYFVMTGATGSMQYSGTTGSLYSGYTLESNLIQNNYNAVNNNTLPQLSYAELNSDRNVTPLFHRLCSNTDDDSIYDWSSSAQYGASSSVMSQRYTVNRNVLYRATTAIATGTTEPYTTASKWSESDFMLVKTFTFHKDRTRAKIYEGTIESLNEATKNSLYFFNSNLTLKNGFTENSFSGSTKDIKLLNALNKLVDAKNQNLRDVNEYGLFGFRKFGSDIIMDYYYAKDNNNLPLTGEFIGGLTLTNPCGHHAKVVFGLLLDADLSNISELSPRQQSNPALPRRSALEFSPNVRLIINQNGMSNVTVSVMTANGGTANGLVNYNKSLKKYEALDKSFTIDEADSIIVKVTYDTNLNKTVYAGGIIDGFKLFDSNDTGINNEYVSATKSNVGKVVTRTITLKDVYEDRVIKLDFNGSNYMEINTVDPKDFIKF